MYIIRFSAHGQFGSCQAGTSGVLLEDETIMIGAPGSYFWKGALFMTSISDDYLNKDKILYHSPVQNNVHSPVERNSYLGIIYKTFNFSLNLYICFD